MTSAVALLAYSFVSLTLNWKAILLRVVRLGSSPILPTDIAEAPGSRSYLTWGFL